MNARVPEKSGVHSKPQRMLPLVEDLKHVHPKLLERVRHAVLGARKRIEGILVNDKGQGILGLNFVENIEVPEDEADEVIREAQSHLAGTGVKLQRTHDSIRAVPDDEREDPRKAIGY